MMKLFKILIPIFVLFFSIFVNAKTIYCYNIYGDLDFRFIESPENADWIEYYEINDQEKMITHLKTFYKIESGFKNNDGLLEDLSSYNFIYDTIKYDKIHKFNKNEIIVSYDEKSKNINYRHYNFFDRISGLNISLSVKLNENGNEYTTNPNDKKFERKDYDNFLSDDDYLFYDYAEFIYKYNCKSGNVF